MYKTAKNMKSYSALIKKYLTANNLKDLFMWYPETSIP